MTIKILSVHPDGSAYCVHSSPSRGEHFFVIRPRDFGDGCVLHCAHCDSLTWVHDSDANEDQRRLREILAAGVKPVDLRPIVVKDGQVNTRRDEHDPLLFAQQDGHPLLEREQLIPGSDAPALASVGTPEDIRSDTPRRIALVAKIRAAHKDRRPPGTRFQKWISQTAFEVREDDGSGKSKKIEAWNVVRRTESFTTTVIEHHEADEHAGEPHDASVEVTDEREVERLERA